MLRKVKGEEAWRGNRRTIEEAGEREKAGDMEDKHKEESRREGKVVG